MLIVFEVYLMAGTDPNSLLSEEVRTETLAQVMTPEQAKAIGFSGVDAPDDGRDLVLIAVAPKDAKFIENRLNVAQPVTGFRAHEVDA